MLPLVKLLPGDDAERSFDVDAHGGVRVLAVLVDQLVEGIDIPSGLEPARL